MLKSLSVLSLAVAIVWTAILPSPAHAVEPSPDKPVESGAINGYTTAAFEPGWVYGRAGNCMVLPVNNSMFVYMFMREGPVFFTNNLTHHAILSPICQNGYLVAFHVIDPSGT